MIDNFEQYAISIDTDVINTDFDDIDFYGDKYLDNNVESDIQFE